MAFLIKRGKIWYICEKFENKFFRKSTGTNSKGKALIKLADYVKNKKSTDGKKTKLFLSIFSQEYLNYLNKNEKSPSYIRGVKNYFQELIDFTGDINVHKIDKTLLNRFLTYKINNASIHTGRAAKSSLRPAFSHAVDLGYIESNPFDGTIKTKVPNPTIKYFTETEFKKILNKIKKSFYHDIAIFAARTGMRLSEILNLRVEEISLKDRVIKVRNTTEHKTKGRRSRIVEIADDIIDILENRIGVAKNYLFEKPDGTPYSCSFISHKFLKFFNEAGVKNKSFKTFRSTYATWLLNAGTSTMYIKNQLGHSTVRLLETHYAEFITEEYRGEVNKINVKRLTQK